MVANEQEAQQVVIRHIGGFAWPTVLLLAFCAGIYGACVLYMLTEPQFSWWVVAGIATCAYAAYTVIHEAVHGAIMGMSIKLRWVNEWAGYVASHMLGVSFIGHRRGHLKHHRATNHPTDDPDMAFSAHSLPSLVAVWFKGIPKEWVFAVTFQHFTAAEKRIVVLEYVAILVTRALLLIFCADLGVTLAILLLGHMVGNAVLTTFFAWIVHHPHNEQERMKTTTVYQARGGLDTVMTLLWGFQNYHAIHHLYPKVPFFRYRKLYRTLEPYLLEYGVPVKQVI
ncbi:MAG: fatty acid desaturase [Halieaceae bacterium]